MPNTLYLRQEPRQFYLIPDGTALPPGALNLRSASGRAIDVDPDVAEVFAVGEAEVAQHLRGVVGEVASALRDGEPVQTPPEQRARIAEALDLEPAQLDDPALVRDAILRRLQSLREDLRAGRENNPARLRSRADKLAKLAREHGLPELAEAADALPEALGKLAQDPELVGRLRGASAALREATAALREQRTKAKGS